MNKGIYLDKKTNKWYIHTTYKGRTITIRGYESQKSADKDFDYAVEKWKREHNILDNSDNYSDVVQEFLNYRSKLIRAESLRKDKTQFKYFDVIFNTQKLQNVFFIPRLKVIYSNLINDSNFSSSKKMRLVLVFRDFAKYCHQTNRITDSVYNEFALIFIPVKEDKHISTTKRYIPETHINAILSDIIKDKDKLFFLAISVLYSCGLRISELLGLLASDIDIENKKIKVQRQLLTSGDISNTLKTTNSYRQVPISCLLLEDLQEIRKKINNNARIFDYSHTTFKRKLKHYTDYSAHEFRHTFCTNLAKKCSNIADVTYCAKVSGHSVSMFLNTYCKSLDNELENKFF